MTYSAEGNCSGRGALSDVALQSVKPLNLLSPHRPTGQNSSRYLFGAVAQQFRDRLSERTRR